MICKFCGNVIEDNSDFCCICGQKVVAETPAYAAPVVPAEEETGKKGKKKAKKAKKAEKSALSKGGRFFTGLFAALFFAVAGVMVIINKPVFAIICAAITAIVAFADYKKYKSAVAAGYEDKALDILNTGMTGLCVGMAVLVLCLIKQYIF